MDAREELAVFCWMILTLHLKWYNIQKKKHHGQVLSTN